MKGIKRDGATLSFPGPSVNIERTLSWVRVVKVKKMITPSHKDTKFTKEEP
jgi:hypothetical protein